MERSVFTFIGSLGNRKFKKLTAFTLIELLVVISIIGVLMAIGVYSYGVIAARSRDNIRKSDIARLQNALQQHYLDLRSYPTFDTTGSSGSGGAPTYSAAWQLTQNTSCPHLTADSLAPRYISKIPEDPSQATDFTSQSCSNLNKTQKQRYIYLTGSDSNGPSQSPTVFGLLTTLEYPSSTDSLIANNNPLIHGNVSTILGPWYSSFDNYGTFGVDANYMVTGQVGR